MCAPEVPPGPVGDTQGLASEFAPQQMLGTHHSWVDLWDSVRCYSQHEICENWHTPFTLVGFEPPTCGMEAHC